MRVTSWPSRTTSIGCGMPDHEMTGRDDEFVGVGDGSVADLDVGHLGALGQRIAHRLGQRGVGQRTEYRCNSSAYSIVEWFWSK